MISFRFLKKPGKAALQDIMALYAAQGWWQQHDKLSLAAAIVRNSQCFLAALDNGRLIGMGRAISDGVSDAYIQDVAVLREYRGQGLGSKIIRRLKTRLKADGINWIGLVAQNNSSAFYSKLGFKVIRRAQPMMLKGNHV
jgi:spermidine synthase